MANFKVFFKSDRLGFHLILAVGIMIMLIIAGVIFLNIYTRHGQEVRMPNFIGIDSKELIQNTSSTDFIIVISDYVYDKSKPEGVVLKQNPQTDEMVKMGRKVYLTVASSIPPKVKMPELKDVSQRQAEIMLKAIGIEIGGVIYKASPFENAVLEQLYRGRAIAPGTDISAGESVTLVVGKDINDLPQSRDSLANPDN